jgi:hypothetical protein
MFNKKVVVKLTQSQIESLLSAIYTQIELVKKAKDQEAKDEIKHLKAAEKLLRKATYL